MGLRGPSTVVLITHSLGTELLLPQVLGTNHNYHHNYIYYHYNHNYNHNYIDYNYNTWSRAVSCPCCVPWQIAQAAGSFPAPSPLLVPRRPSEAAPSKAKFTYSGSLES